MQLLHELAVQQMTTLSSLELSNLPEIEKKEDISKNEWRQFDG